MAKIYKVLLIESNPTIADAIMEKLAAMKQVRVIHFMSTDVEAELHFAYSHIIPDIVLLDSSLDYHCNFHWTKFLTGTYPLLRLVALTDHDDALSAMRMIELGAQGYVFKESLGEGLDDIFVPRTRAVADVILNYQYVPGSNTTVELSQNERHILKLSLNEYSSMEIASELDINIAEVNIALEEVKRKTQAKSAMDLRRYAVREGLW